MKTQIKNSLFALPMVISLVFLLLFASACSVDADLRFLESRSDRISVSGTLCTVDPNFESALNYIVFLMDRSGSMAMTDPNLFRVDAIQSVVDEFYPNENTKFGIITYADGATDETQGLTRDMGFINTGITNSGLANGGTNMQDAAQSAFAMLSNEFNQLEEAELGSAANANVTIINVGDGVPTVPSTNQDNVLSAIELVMTLRETYSLRRLDYHTVFLGDANSAGHIFMQQISALTGGLSIHYDSNSALDLLEEGIDFTPLPIPHQLVDIFINNKNSVSEIQGSNAPLLRPDSDGDGISDYKEINELGSNPLSPDSDDDGVSDRSEVARGLDPNSPQNHCDDDETDLDLDLLTDCEEITRFMDIDYFDSDLDGLIDLHEVRFGTDPLIADASSDPDGDGLTNMEEVKANLNPTIADNDIEESFGHQLSVSLLEVNEAGQYCYAVESTNIKLMDTLDVNGVRTNTIEVLMIQRPTNGVEDADIFVKGELVLDLDEFYSPEGRNEYTLNEIEFQYPTP